MARSWSYSFRKTVLAVGHAACATSVAPPAPSAEATADSASACADSAAAAAIARENSKRLRTMLSVDDLIRDVREYLIQQDEWDNTVMLYTSGEA